MPRPDGIRLAAADPQRIDRNVERAISRATMIYGSAASAWKAAIETQLGIPRFPGSFGAAVEASQFTHLAISFEHAEAVIGPRGFELAG